MSTAFPLDDHRLQAYQGGLIEHRRAGDAKRFANVAKAVLEDAKEFGIGNGCTFADVITSVDQYIATSQALDKQAAAGWLPPQSLAARMAPAPYPVDALPPVMGNAVAEVEGFVQAPTAMVSTSALAALSIAGQALADVRRADGLQGPISLNITLLAESGERKTTCDQKFEMPIREYERKEAERFAPKVAENRALQYAWEAERLGILDAIRKASRDGGSAADFERQLIAHDLRKPATVRVPRVLRTDSTPEALASSLAKDWPVGAIQSSEGGAFFGAHAMGADSVVRHLALLNTLWDGGEFRVDRKTSESFVLRGARLTVAIQVQPQVMLDFLGRNRGLARGSGFLARFLLAVPQTTQGSRAFREPPKGWPHLDAYTRRLSELLAKQPAITPMGSLEPAVLDLDADAKAAWIQWHDSIETQLGTGGDLERLRDIASKAADNVARIAAQFHLLDHGPVGQVAVESIERAGQIVAWHLTEAQRFFGELALPPELAAAARLDSWLIDAFDRKGIESMTRREVQQYGPIRDSLTLDTALAVLTEEHRAKLAVDGKKKSIAVNPMLLRGSK
jgi:putative DNA primase/helicase